MKVKCPVCQTEYDHGPGKCKCVCGAGFWVLPDGRLSFSDPDGAGPDPGMDSARTNRDRKSSPDPFFDPDRTIPDRRFRREHGELQTGDVILGRYELLEKLGSGAMGMVFKCRDRISGVEYALKMVPPELVRDADAMEDVRENFKLVHGLKHPNIAGMDFLDRDEYGSYFLIMEYVQGKSLTQWIRKKWRRGRPDAAEVIPIVKQIAAALDYAHSQQILHRDIKPANIMADERGNVKVLDFGLASKIRSTMTAMSVNPANTSGTPHYLSPEQFKGRYPGPASDQYALAVLTYQMLAGYLPFDADDFNILYVAVVNEEPERPDGVSDQVWLALKKALSKNAKDRFENCTAFAEALSGPSEIPKQEAAKSEPKPEPAKTETPKPEIPKPEPVKQETPEPDPASTLNIPPADLRGTGCSESAEKPKSEPAPADEEKITAPAESQLPDADVSDRWTWLAFHLKSWSFLFLVVRSYLDFLSIAVKDDGFSYLSIPYYKYTFPGFCIFGVVSLAFSWACWRKIVNSRVSQFFFTVPCAMLIFWSYFFCCDIVSGITGRKISVYCEGLFILLVYILEPLKKNKCRMWDILFVFIGGMIPYGMLFFYPHQASRIISEMSELERHARDIFVLFSVSLLLINWLKYKRRPSPAYGLCCGFLAGLGTVAYSTIFRGLDFFPPWFPIEFGIVGALAGFCLERDCRVNWKKSAMIIPVIVWNVVSRRWMMGLDFSLFIRIDYLFMFKALLPLLFECAVLYVIQWIILAKNKYAVPNNNEMEKR